MNIVRNLLSEITAAPSLLARLGDDADLARHGVSSGDLIRLVVTLEERYGLAIDADDLDGLRTLGDFERLAHRQLDPYGVNTRCGANERQIRNV